MDREDLEDDGELDKESKDTSAERAWFKKTLIIIFSIFAVIVIAVGSYWAITRYTEEKERLARQKVLEDEFELYSAPNFDDGDLNFSILDYESASPGSTIDLIISYKNTGKKPVDDLKILAITPDNTILVEESLKGREYEYKDGRLEIPVGSVQTGQGGDLTFSYKIESPLDNGTVIEFSKVEFSYTKVSQILKKDELFITDISPEGRLTVQSAPDFSTSYFSVSQESKDGNLKVTFGDSIEFSLFLYNSGDTYGDGVYVQVYGISDLTLEETGSTFETAGDHIGFDIGRFEPNEGRLYSFRASVMDGLENGQVLKPYAEIHYGGEMLELEGPEILVRLFPSFEGSSLSLADINGHGVYSDDLIDASITITNTGDVDASDIIVDLVFSNLFELFEGTNHWEIDSLGVGQSQTLTSRLKIVSGITKDSYASAGFTVKAQDIDKFTSQDYSILVNGSKPFTRNLIPIVGIHGIEPSPQGAYELSIEKFDYLCGTLKSLGYETITFRDLLDYLDYGKTLPEKPVIITSDDGYRSTYAYAMPILQKYGYKMTVFLVTGLVGDSEADRRYNEFDFQYSYIPRRPLLIWQEIYQMSNYGCEFLSHTVTHRLLGGLSVEEAVAELSQSKQAIEARLGKAVPFVSWPHDNYSPDLIALLPQLGYRGAIRYSGGVEDVRSINIYAIKRVAIFASTNPGSYAALLKLE